VAKNPPKKMVDAFVHTLPNAPSCSEAEYGYGQISAPTPEPITLALLALGLPAGLLIRRRRED
jgi:hypothetical protein